MKYVMVFVREWFVDITVLILMVTFGVYLTIISMQTTERYNSLQRAGKDSSVLGEKTEEIYIYDAPQAK